MALVLTEQSQVSEVGPREGEQQAANTVGSWIAVGLSSGRREITSSRNRARNKVSSRDKSRPYELFDTAMIL